MASAIALVAMLIAPPAKAARVQTPPPDVPKDEAPVRTWKATIGGLAPDFTLPGIDGEEVTLSKLRGQTVVLEWFLPTCPVVKAAHRPGAPLANLGNELNARADVTWLAINSSWRGTPGSDREANQKGRVELGMVYPVLLDEAGWVGRMYGADRTPQMFVIAPDGRLAYAGGHEDGAGGSLIAPAVDAVRRGVSPPEPRTRHFGCRINYAKGPRLGSSLPDVVLRDIDGTTHSLGDYRGRPLVLEWFNPTCPFVIRAYEGGVLEGAAARWAARGVSWVSVNSAHTAHETAEAELNRATRDRWGLVHPLWMDPQGKLGHLLEVKTSPQILILDERGVLVYTGAHDDKEGQSYVDRALEELQAGEPVSVSRTAPYGCRIKYASRSR